MTFTNQVAGVTEMTDLPLIEKLANGSPGKVEKGRTYDLTLGKAHVDNGGDVHSPRREFETRLIRIEASIWRKWVVTSLKSRLNCALTLRRN